MKYIVTVFILGIVLCLAVIPSAQSQSEFDRPFEDATVIANFIYNLIDYVSWPNENSTTRICTMNDSHVHKILAAIKLDEEFKNPIEILRNPENYDRCHIIYISRNSLDQTNSILEKISGKPILSVSDVANFSAQGGGITFVLGQDYVGLEVNLNTIKRANLEIDAELLEIMEIIQ